MVPSRPGLIVLICFAILLSITGRSAAQETANALRDLAAQKNFYIGAALYTPHWNDPGYVDTFAREFNMLTPENEAKFCELQAEQGQFDFRRFDTLISFA